MTGLRETLALLVLIIYVASIVIVASILWDFVRFIISRIGERISNLLPSCK